MSKFELLKHESTGEVIEHTYFIQDDQGKLIYKEWVCKGKVIDFTLRDKDGYDIDDPEMVEQVQEFIDTLSIEI
jgi:hypothetical protein